MIEVNTYIYTKNVNRINLCIIRTRVFRDLSNVNENSLNTTIIKYGKIKSKGEIKMRLQVSAR